MTPEEKTKKMDTMFQEGMRKINETGQKIIFLLKSKLKQQEQKKVEELTKKLKS